MRGDNHGGDVGRTSKPPLHSRATAQFRGTCARCEGLIQVGARIALYPDLGGWSHVVCPRQSFTEADVKGTTEKLDSPLMAALKERQLSRLAAVKCH